MQHSPEMTEPETHRVLLRRKKAARVRVATLFASTLVTGLVVGSVVARFSAGRPATNLRPLGQTGNTTPWPMVLGPGSPALPADGPSTGRTSTSVQPNLGATPAPGSSTPTPVEGTPTGSSTTALVLVEPMSGQAPPQEIIARVKSSVVLVLARTAAGWGSGSGVVLDSNRVATCAHVVKDALQTLVLTADGRQLGATVAAADTTDDVAVLVTGAGLPPAATLGNSDQVREGDEVAVTGFPVVDKFYAEGFAAAASTSRGSIAARRNQLVEGVLSERLQTDATMNPGNSGGPLYSLRDGSVIGLAQSMMAEERGLYFATTVNALRRLLQR